MPSRRSDRGGALRRQLERAEEMQPELEAAIEERRRFEAERDYLYSVGWEEFDSLDTDTRQDLLRESAVFGGIEALLDVATSPRRVAMRAGARELLKRYAPRAAKALWGRGPSRSAKGLMDRIREVRANRNRIPDKPTAPNPNPDKPGAMLPKDAIDQSARASNRVLYETIKHGPDIPREVATQAVRAANSPALMNIREMLGNDETNIRPDLIQAIGDLFRAGERRVPVLSKEERKLRKKQEKEERERRRKDDPYTATDEEYNEVFRGEKVGLKR